MYAVTASIHHETEMGSYYRELPTFYLHKAVQGITSEEAAKEIARQVVDPFRQYDHRLRMTVVEII